MDATASSLCAWALLLITLWQCVAVYTNTPEHRAGLYMKESSLPFQDLAADLSTSEETEETTSGIGHEVSCGVRKHTRIVRIVGGSNAHPGEFPWMASIQLVTEDGVKHICGGAVLSSYWVITSGHCLKGVELDTVLVVVGDHDLWRQEGTEQRRKLMRVVIRPDIDVTHFKNDIALLQLDHPLTLDKGSVAPICLPLRSSKHYTGEGIVAGWGRLSENGTHNAVLQYAELPFLPLRRCHKAYGALGYTEYLDKKQLCLGVDQGGKDTCQGDSGGPLVCHGGGRYYLCGLISWGFGCARPNTPGIYTHVAPYASWIKSVLYHGYDELGAIPADLLLGAYDVVV